MTRILDKYILRRFCATLGYTIVAFVFIVIFVDMVGNLGKFIDRDVPQIVILKYYSFYVPYILVLALPIAMLLASLFSVGQMAKYNELTAIRSAGISLTRILLPVFLASVFISALAIGIGEMVVPPANQRKTNITNQYLESGRSRSPTSVTDIFWRDKTNRRLFIGRYETRTKTAHKISIQTLDGNQIVERIDAPEMRWQDSTWVLLRGYRRTFSNKQEKAEPFEELSDDNIDIKPEKLAESKIAPEDMSFQELRVFTDEVLRNGGDPNRWLVDLHFKLSIPFANFIMVLFGAPLASRKRNSNAVFGFIISLLVCFLYYGSNTLVKTLGQNGDFPPLFAAWVTNLVFFVCGLLVLFFSRK